MSPPLVDITSLVKEKKYVLASRKLGEFLQDDSLSYEEKKEAYTYLLFCYRAIDVNILDNILLRLIGQTKWLD